MLLYDVYNQRKPIKKAISIAKAAILKVAVGPGDNQK